MRILGPFVVVVLSACGAAVGSLDAGQDAAHDASTSAPDASQAADSGNPLLDAGAQGDAGEPADAGLDAGTGDAGSSFDAGTTDAGPPPFCTRDRVTPIAHGFTTEVCINHGTAYSAPFVTCDQRYSQALDSTGKTICAINAAEVVFGFDGEGLATENNPYHVCELTLDKTVRCRGYNLNGQLGRPPARAFFPNQDIADLTDIRQLAAGGGAFTCALTAQAKVVCWGGNSAGQLGVPASQLHNSATPLEIAGLTNVVQIAADSSGACAVTSTGAVRCWGAPWGPVVTDKTDVTGATAIAGSGNVGYCAIVTGGTVKCWGNGSLQAWVYMGTPYDPANTQVAFVIPGLNNITRVAVGDGYSGYGCALDSSGVMKCWGTNYFGQLGIGAGSDSTTPVSPIGLTQVSDISAFGGRTCAVWGASRAVSCWGAGVNVNANATTPKLGGGPQAQAGVKRVFAGFPSTFFTTDTLDVLTFF
jgi:Regulator of chromosome condensation (RCC1) repeat